MASSISYRLLSPAFVGRTVDCIAASFAEDPFSKVSGLEPKDWAAMSSMFVERAAEKDFSVIAVNSSSGEVEGIMLNEDWKERKPDEYSKLSTKWRPIRAIFNKVHLSFKASHKRYIQPHSVLHPLYFSCVRPEYRKRGIATQLFKESLNIASDNHFDTVVCETSTNQTTEAVTNLGFKEIAAVEYRSFLYEGETVFYPLPSMNPDYQKLLILERPIQSGLVM